MGKFWKWNLEGGKKMNEEYLPVEKSLGYINLKQAFEYVFGYFPTEINKFKCEDFGFVTKIENQNVSISIGKTKKNQQFNSGEGGQMTVYLIDELDESGLFLSLWDVMSDEERIKTHYLRTAGVSGSNKELIISVLQVLKKYLDKK